MTHLFDTNPAGRHLVVSRKIAPELGSKNLLPNPGFEQGGSFWGDAGGSGTLELETAAPLEGNQSLRIIPGIVGLDTVVPTRNAAPFAPANAQNLSSVVSEAVEEGDVFRLMGISEARVNEQIAIGVREFDHRGVVVGLENVLVFQNSGLVSGTPYTKTAFYRVPAGVRHVMFQIVGLFLSALPNGARVDGLDFKRHGAQTNLLLNSEFEDAGAFWTPINIPANVAIESVDPIFGGASLKLTSDTVSIVGVRAGAYGLDLGTTPTERLAIPVEAGQIYDFESTARAQADHDCRVFIQPADADGNGIGQPSVAVATHSGLEPTTEGGSFQIPDGVEYVTYTLEVAPDASGPRDYFFDRVSMQLAESSRMDRLDETRFTSGVWESPQLNRGGSLTHRLVKLFLQYSCEADSTVEIQFTSNGWRTATNRRTVRLDSTEDSIGQVIVQANVTGHDIRFRLWLNEKLVSIFGYRTEQYPANQLNILGD